jgi:multidrug resistance efflux pump
MADFLSLKEVIWRPHRKAQPVNGQADRSASQTVTAALVLLYLVIQENEQYPRTDDANVRANYIEIVAEVSGRLVQLPVKDNALVKKDDLLFAIDPRPYKYALSQALSDQADLERQIIDEQRRIAAQNSAVEAARATLVQSTTGINTAISTVDVETPKRIKRYLHGGLSRAFIRHVKRNRADALVEFIYQVIQSSWVARCGD